MSNASTPTPDLDPNSWVLVRWDENTGVFPEYSVLQLNSILDDTRDVQVGNTIMLRYPRELLSRRALVLKISDSRSTLMENKELLDSQNQGLQAAFSCRTSKYLNNNSRVASYEIAASVKDYRHNGLRDRFDCVINGYSNMAHNSHSTHTNTSTPLKKRIIETVDQGTQTEPTDSTSESHYQLKKKRFFNLLQNLYIQCIMVFAEMQDLNSILCHAPPDLRSTPRAQAYMRKALPEIPTDNEGNEIVVANQIELNDVVMEEVAEKENVEPNCSFRDKQRSRNKRKANVNPYQFETPLGVRRVSAQASNQLDDSLIPLGSGHASIRGRLLHKIDWSSYTSATRHLLQAVFSRKVLATHSLTGKQSPAFANKPAKKRLDQNIVSDIVATVSQRCGVPPRMVRNCITIKCTDEAKLYRKRQRVKTQPAVPALENGPANEIDE